eukprot:EC096147.1.p5 GENE.EC096147.1~~EC096147.1.p5  ORF type:complete len:114 (-),score=11.29 EC096147.1:145-486(-)
MKQLKNIYKAFSIQYACIFIHIYKCINQYPLFKNPSQKQPTNKFPDFKFASHKYAQNRNKACKKMGFNQYNIYTRKYYTINNEPCQKSKELRHAKKMGLINIIFILQNIILQQ